MAEDPFPPPPRVSRQSPGTPQAGGDARAPMAVDSARHVRRGWMKSPAQSTSCGGAFHSEEFGARKAPRNGNSLGISSDPR